MDFGKALEALKAGKKVRRPYMYPEWVELGNVSNLNDPPDCYKRLIIRDKTESSIDYWKPDDADGDIDILAEDWEILEDFPEVKLHIKEYFTCPKCGHECNTFDELAFELCGVCHTKVKFITKKPGRGYVENASGIKDSI